MNYRFSQAIDALKPSVIREILKNTANPDIIPLAAGNPAPESFPLNDIADISARIMRENPVDALQYSITEGYTPLRESVKKRMSEKFDSVKEFDDVIITSGAQQVMYLTTKSLCDIGDTVICESPTFIGSLNAFRSFGLNLRGITMDDDGMNLESLEKALQEETRAKIIYVIPNFQNPSGLTTSFEKRKGIYELAKKYGLVIIEDNPYGETRFDGEDIPNIKSIDTDGIVVYAGTFSKVISPGMRVGYAIAPKALMAKITVGKQISDVHTNIFSQMIVNEFITNCDFDAHISRVKEINRRKYKIMSSMLDELCSDMLSYHKTQGGLFLWCKLPDSIDMLDFCGKAIENSVAVVPGNAFLTDESERSSNIRLNFTTPSDEKLEKGIEILAKTLKESLK